MIEKVIADTAAIVAYLNRRDQWNREAVRLFEELPKPFYTCEAVITETCFRVSKSAGGIVRVFDLIASGILRIDFSVSDEADELRRLIKKYESVPMSLADACLVRMSELNNSQVFTFDSDFRIYRRFGRQRIPLVGLDD